MRWVDCFASADPVSNGRLLDGRLVEEESKEVCNQSSILNDHTSYWANRDEFVTLLIQQLTQPELRSEAGLPPAPDLALDGRSLDWIGRRRRWRVGILSAISGVGILSVLLAVYQEFQDWWTFLAYWAFQILPQGSRWLGGASEAANGVTVPWPALGFLALVLVPYLITRWRWQVWNGSEMRALVEDRISAVGYPDLLVLTGLGVQLLIAVCLLYGRFLPSYAFISVFVGVVLLVIVTRPSALGNSKPTEAYIPSEKPLTGSEKLSWKA